VEGTASSCSSSGCWSSASEEAGIPLRFGIAHDRTTDDNDANEEIDIRKEEEEEEEEEELPVVTCPCAARVFPAPSNFEIWIQFFRSCYTDYYFFPTNWEPIENLKGTCLFFHQKGLGKLWKLLFY
jgi:hypothetical protein